jgi:hypothetical protein
LPKAANILGIGFGTRGHGYMNSRAKQSYVLKKWLMLVSKQLDVNPSVAPGSLVISTN